MKISLIVRLTNVLLIFAIGLPLFLGSAYGREIRHQGFAGVSNGSIYVTADKIGWTNVPGYLNVVVSGDFNGDGRDDLAGLSGGGIYFTVDKAIWKAIPGYLEKLVVGDFNGDGKDDLAGLSGGSIYLSLDRLSWSKLPGFLNEMVAGDFDNDGRDDLAGLNNGAIYYTTDKVNWLRVPGYLNSLVSGDFNDDGKDDLAGLNAGAIYYTTNEKEWVNIPGYLNRLVAGDFDGDGKDDLAGLSGRNIYYTLNRKSWALLPGYLDSIVSGDLDGDKKDDIAGLSSGSIYYTVDRKGWINVPGHLDQLIIGDFDFTPPVQKGFAGLNTGAIYLTVDRATWRSIPGGLTSIVSGDLNGDGRDDLAGLSNGSIYYTLDKVNWVSIPGFLNSMVIGDFNGDRRDDLAGLSNGAIYYTVDKVHWAQVPGFLNTMIVGDFDGDGRDDLAGLSNGAIYYTVTKRAWKRIPGYLTSISAGDLNGDGKSDLLGLSSGILYYTTNRLAWGRIPGQWDSVIAGDMNGDRRDDIVGLSFGAIFYTLDRANWRNIPGRLDSVLVSDLNGDKRADLAGINDGAIYYTLDRGTWINVPGTLEALVAGDFRTPPGSWSPVIDFPLVPAAAANLPDGRVLLWSAYERFDFSPKDFSRTYSAFFDWRTNGVSERLVTETGHDMFCPGTSNLGDGRLLVSGGVSTAQTSIFNPFDNTWKVDGRMQIPRAYQGNTVLSDGRVFTLGGSWSGGLGGKDGEVWSAWTGWQLLAGVPVDPILGPDPAGIYRADNHAWLFAAGGGWVFHAGPSAQMNWISTSGTGGVISAGMRGDDGYSMNGNAAMFDAGRILKVGGAPAYEQGVNATSSAYVIETGVPGSVPTTVTKVAPMSYARAFANSVVLPNGQVVVIGGMSKARLFSDQGAIMTPELWDPTLRSFTPLQSMQVPRTYHSVALLLPDGRVLSAGGGLCGQCPVNHPNGQILTPPYLLNSDGSPATRPTITLAPSEAAPGGEIYIATDMPIAGFVLMRLSSVTHSVNNDQRRIPLYPTEAGYNLYSAHLPGSSGTLPPGFYMLFAMSYNGVPSVSTPLRIL